MRVLCSILVSLMCGLVVAEGSAQDRPDLLRYTLLQAGVNRAEPLIDHIEVEFGQSFPIRYSKLPRDEQESEKSSENPEGVSISIEVQANEWVIQATHNQSGEVTIVRPTGLRAVLDQHANLIYLRVPDLPDVTMHRIVITLREGNFPEVVLAEPRNAARYQGAHGRQDSHIYFRGNVLAVHNKKPNYSVDTKLSYLHQLGVAGAVGGLFTAVSEHEADIDPDAITATVSHEKVVTLGRGSGVIIRSNFGKEFDSNKANRNVVAGANAKLVVPSTELFGGRVFGTVDGIVGFEGGKNYKNTVSTEGIGGFRRWLVGADLYLRAVRTGSLRQITAAVEWRVRLPSKAEVLSRDGETRLTDESRHHLLLEIDLMFSKAAGIAVAYEYGSLPPAFNFVGGKMTAGLVIKLLQTP